MTGRTAIEVGLTAAIVAVDGDEPMTLTAGDGAALTGLPSGPFDPLEHHTFESGLRNWVSAQTGLSVGYVEQLYTFGDRGREAPVADMSAMGDGPSEARRIAQAISCSSRSGLSAQTDTNAAAVERFSTLRLSCR